MVNGLWLDFMGICVFLFISNMIIMMTGSRDEREKLFNCCVREKHLLSQYGIVRDAPCLTAFVEEWE